MRHKPPNPKGAPAYIRGGFVSIWQGVMRLKGTNAGAFIMYGLLFDMVNHMWRPFAPVFLERLGGSDMHFSLLNALPGLVGAFVLLPGALLFRKFTDQKRATALFIFLSRLLLLALASIPAMPRELGPLLFVALVAIMNCPDALSQTSLQSLLGSVFNGSERGQAIALRTKFGQAVIPAVTILSGLAITFIPADDAQRMVMYQIFFAFAFGLGLVEIFVFNKLKVGGAAAEAGPRLPEKPLGQLLAISRDRVFRKFFVPALCFTFTWQAAWPLFSIYQVRVLEATEMWFAVYALMAGIGALMSGGFWQRLLRRRGNGATLVVAAGLISLNALVLPFVPNVQMMALMSLFGGFFAIGINTAMLNGVLEATPDGNRMMYLAFYNTALNVSLFLAPIFAAVLLARTNIAAALVSIGFMRLCATAFIWFAGRRGP